MCFGAVFVRSHLRISLWIILGIILLLIQCHDFCRALRRVESGEDSLKIDCVVGFHMFKRSVVAQW